MNQQKMAEYGYLKSFVALLMPGLELNENNTECGESPDFVVNLENRRIGVEITDHYSDDIDVNGRPRQATEADWESLRGAIMDRVWRDSVLEKTEGIFEFKGLEVPRKKEFGQFIEELIQLARAMLRSHHDVSGINEEYPLLKRYLIRMHLKSAECFISRTWNYDSGWVGLTEEELIKTIGRKTTLADNYRADMDELWLVVVEGYKISQGMGLFLERYLEGFERVDRLLSESRFERAFIYQYMHGVVYCWPGWTKVGQEKLIETIKGSS